MNNNYHVVIPMMMEIALKFDNKKIQRLKITLGYAGSYEGDIGLNIQTPWNIH